MKLESCEVIQIRKELCLISRLAFADIDVEIAQMETRNSSDELAASGKYEAAAVVLVHRGDAGSDDAAVARLD
jgi:hypothetical protein